MVISDNFNFTFIRIPKNASTSLATFFVKNCCGPNAKFTGIGDARIQSQNINNAIINKYRRQYRFIHLTLQEIVENGVMTDEEARQRETIGVIRHPLDRQLSLYFFKRRKQETSVSDFRQYMAEGFDKTDGSNHILQSEYLTLNGMTVGQYWPYERLNEYLKFFMARHKIEPKFDLPNFKSNFRKTALVDEYYDKGTRRAVEDYFQKDIELYEGLMR